MHLDLEAKAAAATDLPELVALYLDAMREAIGSAHGSWDAAREAAEFREQLDLSRTVVLRAATTLVAFTMIRAIGGHTLEVHTLCVAPAFQRKGLGSRLLRQTIREAAAMGAAVELSVLKANQEARALYERLGFRQIGATERHLRLRIGPEDSWLREN